MIFRLIALNRNRTTMSSIREEFAALDAKMAAHKLKLREIIDIETDIWIHVAILRDKWLSNSCHCEGPAIPKTHITKDLFGMTLNGNDGGDGLSNQSVTASFSSSSTTQLLSPDHLNNITPSTSAADNKKSPQTLQKFSACSNSEYESSSTDLLNKAKNCIAAAPSPMITVNEIQEMSFMNAEEILRCFSCRNRFTSIQALQKHSMHCCSLVCTVCKKCFSNKKKYNQHVKMHNEGSEFDELKLAERNEQRPVAKSAFSCRVCGKRFIRRFDLMQHCRVHKASKQTLFNCNMCGKSFMSQDHLKQHSSFHAIDQ